MDKTAIDSNSLLVKEGMLQRVGLKVNLTYWHSLATRGPEDFLPLNFLELTYGT